MSAPTRPGLLRQLQSGVRKRLLARRVVAQKRARAASADVYTDTPTISVVIQSFNHRENIQRIVSSLRRTIADEIIVCEDGSIDGSDQIWRQELRRPNDFVLLSNDLHEIRTYNRAANFAKGEIIGFLQDDDIPSDNPDWVSDAISLFRRHPRLAVLGCWNGCMLNLDEFFQSTAYGPNYYGPNYFPEPSKPISLIDPGSGVPFMFVDVVGIGPIFCRRTDFEALGGFDTRLSGPGEPGVWLDYDICLRAWVSGRQVGLYETAPLERGVGGRGTRLFGNAKLEENWRKNRRHVEKTFASEMEAVHAQITRLNAGLLPRTNISAAIEALLLADEQGVADGPYRGARGLAFDALVAGRGYVKRVLVRLHLFHLVTRLRSDPE